MRLPTDRERRCLAGGERLLAQVKAIDLSQQAHPKKKDGAARIEIWDTASASSQTLSEGWIAQAFHGTTLPKGVGVDSIVIDTNALPSTGPSTLPLWSLCSNWKSCSHGGSIISPAVKSSGWLWDGRSSQIPGCC